MAAKKAFSTPVNTISRKDLVMLIRNNTLDDSFNIVSDHEKMETDSPLTNRKQLKTLELISKKLFHSPKFQNKQSNIPNTLEQNNIRRPKKRKHLLIPGNDERIKEAYVKEYDRDGYSPSPCEGMRKKVLMSLFHNKEYSMDLSE